MRVSVDRVGRIVIPKPLRVALGIGPDSELELFADGAGLRLDLVAACDTSVAIAALDATHVAHRACRRLLVERRPALAGHAMFETYSVLTRLPIPLRLTAEQAGMMLAAAFPDACWLGPSETERFRDRLVESGVVGGSVYDALVGEAARVNGRVLLTRDRRAERIYRILDADHRFVE